MLAKKDSVEFRSLIDGVKMRPLVWGDKTILCEFKLEKGFKIPTHHHPYEQTGYLISGNLNFRIGNTWHATNPGDSWCIPENTGHEVEILEDSVLVEIFSPVRPDYLP